MWGVVQLWVTVWVLCRCGAAQVQGAVQVRDPVQVWGAVRVGCTTHLCARARPRLPGGVQLPTDPRGDAAGVTGAEDPLGGHTR